MLDKRITSVENRWVKLARALRSPRGRAKHSAFLVEGTRAAGEAMSSGRALACLIDEALASRANVAEVLARAKQGVVETLLVEPMLFASLCETASPQGVLIIVADIALPLGALLGARPQLVVISDGIQDPGNMGTLIRLADGVGANAFVATEGSVDLYNDKVVRASVGSLFHLAVSQNVSPAHLLTMLAESNYSIVAAEPRGTSVHYDFRYQMPLAVVFGNEGAGLSVTWREAAHLVRIPLWGRAESLNVSISAGVLLYEIVRQWQGRLLVPQHDPML